jgi:hypothetical protein
MTNIKNGPLQKGELMDPNELFIEFLNEYGIARFGDDWWPGTARDYFTDAQIERFSDVLNDIEEDN